MKYGSAWAAVAPAATGTPTSPPELETEPSATASIAKEVVERIKRMFKPAKTKVKLIKLYLKNIISFEAAFVNAMVRLV